jgi:hypothetical protein
MLTFYNAMVVPVLLYGSENLAVNVTDRRITDTAEMKVWSMFLDIPGGPSEKYRLLNSS